MSVAPVGPVDAAVVAESHRVLATHARTFRLASLFLPRGRRDDAAVVYAFCRLVDDIADESPNAEEAREGLAGVEAGLAGDGTALPVVHAFHQVAARCDIPIGAAEELIAGVRSDLGPVALADDRELLRYAYRVAGTVGLMMCGVLGVSEPVARPHAIDLGIAMQLTNICRDVAEDAARGRVYLPANRLRAAGTSPEALLAGNAPAHAVGPVVRDLLAVAEHYYRSGHAGMRFIPARARLAILAAARVYRAIGKVIARRRHRVLDGRAVVSRAGKARELTAAVGLWLATPLARLVGGRRHDAGLHVALDGLPGTAVAGP